MSINLNLFCILKLGFVPEIFEHLGKLSISYRPVKMCFNRIFPVSSFFFSSFFCNFRFELRPVFFSFFFEIFLKTFFFSNSTQPPLLWNVWILGIAYTDTTSRTTNSSYEGKNAPLILQINCT